MRVSDDPGTTSLLLRRLLFPPPEQGERDLVEVEPQCISKDKKTYFNELKNFRELLLHSMYILDRKQVPLLGISNGTVVGVGSVITVPLSLLLAWVDQPRQSIVFFICCESGGGMLGKVYL